MWPRVIPGPRPSEGRHTLTTVRCGLRYAARPGRSEGQPRQLGVARPPPPQVLQLPLGGARENRVGRPRPLLAPRTDGGSATAVPQAPARHAANAGRTAAFGPTPLRSAARRRGAAHHRFRSRTGPRRRAIRRASSLARPQIGRDYPLNLSISVSGGKETN